MANVDMCEHDWPGSGCRKCFPRTDEVSVTQDDSVRDGISKEEFINRVIHLLDNEEINPVIAELEGRK